MQKHNHFLNHVVIIHLKKNVIRLAIARWCEGIKNIEKPKHSDKGKKEQAPQKRSATNLFRELAQKPTLPHTQGYDGPRAHHDTD